MIKVNLRMNSRSWRVLSYYIVITITVGIGVIYSYSYCSCRIHGSSYTIIPSHDLVVIKRSLGLTQLSCRIDRDVSISLNDIEIVRFIGRISIVTDGDGDMKKRKEVFYYYNKILIIYKYFIIIINNDLLQICCVSSLYGNITFENNMFVYALILY